MRTPPGSRTIELEPDKPLAVTVARGARVRVVDGTIWATTSGSLDDVRLQSGDEHLIPNEGLTVLEAVNARSSVALTTSIGLDQTSLRHAIVGMAAVAMTLATIVLLVILPAQLSPGAVEACAPTASSDARLAAPIQ